MEQKTEASQAVDDQAVSVEVYSNAVWLTKGMQVFRLAYTGESDADRNWYAGQLRAALKAQPAPTIAAKPVKYEQRFVSPQGIAAVWHDAQAETFHRHRSNGDLGDGWVHEVRALYAGPPAPTGAPTELKDHNVRQLVNELRDIAIQFHDAGQLRARISGAVGQFLDTHGLPKSPTEAAQGAQPSGNPGELVQGWDVDDLINDMDINEEVAGMRAELQANSTIIPSILAAQGEDSARLECAHANGRTASWDWITCDDCGAIYTGSGEREWGVAQNMWFKSVSEAKFYKENGRYPDRARASAETGGVKP